MTPLLFVAAVLLLLGNMLADHQSRVPSLAGLGIILLGVPAYWLFRRSSEGAGDSPRLSQEGETENAGTAAPIQFIGRHGDRIGIML